MSTVSNYLVRRDGQQYGPYTFDVLLNYYKQGQILKTDLVWTNVFESWITAAEMFPGVSLGGEPPRAEATGAEAITPPASPQIVRPEAVAPRRTRRTLRPWVWGASAVVVVAALVVLAVLLSGSKPEDSLDHARAAYLQRDQANFDRYVDVASVLSDSVDQIVGAMMQQNNTGSLARLAIGAAVPALKSVYLPSASRAIDQFIISGALPQDPQSPGGDAAGSLIAGYVSAAIRKVAMSGMSYQGVETKSISGNSATLDVRVATPLSSKPALLRVRMQKADGYWRLVAIEDLAGLFRELGGLSAQGGPSNGAAVAAPATSIAVDTSPDLAPTSVSPGGAAPTFPVPPDMPAPAPPGSASDHDPTPAPAASTSDDDPIGPGGFITPPDR